MRENAIMFTKFQYYKNNCNYIEGTKKYRSKEKTKYMKLLKKQLLK